MSTNIRKTLYRNDLKFSDRYAWANSAYPDQEQSDQGLHCLPFRLHRWTHYSMVEPHSSNFRVITTNIWVSEYLGNLRYMHLAKHARMGKTSAKDPTVFYMATCKT